MEAWRKCWREQVAPKLATVGLEGLREALRNKYVTLVRSDFYKIDGGQHTPYGGACAIGYALCKELGVPVVSTEEFHRRTIMFEVRERFPEWISNIGFFTNWFDDNPLTQTMPQLLYEVELELAIRSGQTEEIEEKELQECCQ